MPRIQLSTEINAPIETCFDLARSIDLHLESMKDTDEQAIAGVKSGLIGFNESVTWQARHFGIKLRMTIKITELMYATSFTDEQVTGPFKYLRHRHVFQFINPGKTLMLCDFDFASPLGLLGNIVDKLILTPYLTKLLLHRNLLIRETAEINRTSNVPVA